MNVVFSKNACHNLEKLEKAVQQRIVDKTEFYFSQKNPLEHAEKMKDNRFGQWRLRIGDYRILFDVENDCAFILKVGHRREVYR
jgi:mRNA interferase RelE/StbE